MGALKVSKKLKLSEEDKAKIIAEGTLSEARLRELEKEAE